MCVGSLGSDSIGPETMTPRSFCDWLTMMKCCAYFLNGYMRHNKYAMGWLKYYFAGSPEEMKMHMKNLNWFVLSLRVRMHLYTSYQFDSHSISPRKTCGVLVHMRRVSSLCLCFVFAFALPLLCLPLPLPLLCFAFALLCLCICFVFVFLF